MNQWNKYWAFSGERAVKTVAQVALATIGVTAAGILEVDWMQVASVSALAGVMSLMTSVLTYDKKPNEFDDFGNPALRSSSGRY
jgi:hypothetical protein